jgi:hypothetical protein
MMTARVRMDTGPIWTGNGKLSRHPYFMVRYDTIAHTNDTMYSPTNLEWWCEELR